MTIGLSVISIQVNALESTHFGTLKPYVGAGMQMTRIRSNDDVTNTLFKDTVLGTNATVGLQIGEYFGIEIEAERSKNRQNEKVISGSLSLPGNEPHPLPGPGIQDIITSLKTHAINVGLISQFSLNKIYPTLKNTKICANIGISRTTATASILQSWYEIYGHPAYYESTQVINNKIHKIIPFVQLGFSQEITHNMRLRIFGEWKQLNKLHFAKDSTDIPLNLKNTMTTKINIVYVFN